MVRDLTSAADIRRGVTEPDRQTVYRFRYAVIVNELKLAIEAADHRRRMVIYGEDDRTTLDTALPPSATGPSSAPCE